LIIFGRSFSAGHFRRFILPFIFRYERRRSWAGLSHLAKGFDGFRFRVVDVENRQELGDLQQIAYALRQLRQFDRAARVSRGCIQGYEDPEAAGINVVHLAQIEEDVLVLRHSFLDLFPQQRRLLAEYNPAGAIHHENSVLVSRCQLQLHKKTSLRL
jgi:hypothetical protein